MQILLDKIKRDKGLDLSGYKETTLRRRIERRMQFDGAKSLEEYIQMIDRDHRLYWRLVSDFFIGVTDFFRDKEVWEVVQSNILPEIIERRMKSIETQNFASLPIRIWSAGCSTGEETYSLAIAFRNILDGVGGKKPLVFIHGTDILEDKLDIAKKGEYPKEKIEPIGKDLIDRYFEQRNTHYVIRNTIKYMTRFKKLDLAFPKDYAGFDMVVCRNVLIYFQRTLQDKIVRYFHKALRPEGFLWLGKSENLSRETEGLFETVYKSERIFRRKSNCKSSF